MSEVTNILLVGVGGQGTILVSSILCKGLVEAGYDVKMSEVHGMSQRGGSVSTTVRFGKKVHSPIIGEGQADILVSFEAMEALRWLDYVKPEGKVVVNDKQIKSAPILSGKADYPVNAIELLSSKIKTDVVTAEAIAMELGNVRCQNVVLLGSLIERMGLTDVNWEDIVAKTVKKAFIDLNVKALNSGRAAVLQ
ncbi:indolepyruvate oxidoreductase subunit beta [uncultured Cohaesibacter sp.]|uniref:indolepyruvate oxidoreductase subunit beta n=1 Tax=uncultured Cohaesibacter sp. TaxID=1002546 RepID=UPI0029C69593|nr:indolepyruvate oxidoreductase subunit beta [uncultured Cohaesibacter sp.]